MSPITLFDIPSTLVLAVVFAAANVPFTGLLAREVLRLCTNFDLKPLKIRDHSMAWAILGGWVLTVTGASSFKIVDSPVTRYLLLELLPALLVLLVVWLRSLRRRNRPTEQAASD